MQVIKRDNVAMYDCDDTLVLWRAQAELIYFPPGDVIDIPHPSLTKDHNPLVINRDAIRHMEHLYKTGTSIVVWSAAGWEWAEAVVKALKLEHMVTTVMSKPAWYIDDLPVYEWFGNWRQVRPDGSIVKHNYCGVSKRMQSEQAELNRDREKNP